MADTRPVLTKDHPFYEVFIKFHSDQYSNDLRQKAKVYLHDLHYGNWDTTKAMEEAKAVKALTHAE